MAEGKAAEAAYLKAIELDARLPGPYRQLARLYAGSRQFDQALAKLGETLTVNANNVGALMLAGVIHDQRGDIPKAREFYEKVLALNLRFAPGANNLAWVLSRTRWRQGQGTRPRPDRQGAGPRVEESAAKLPSNPQIQYHLGIASAQVRDNEAARQALSIAAAPPAPFPGQDEASATSRR